MYRFLCNFARDAQGFPIEVFQQMFLTDQAQFFPVAIICERLHHIRTRMNEFAM